jgi:hypothetical protein
LKSRAPSPFFASLGVSGSVGFVGSYGAAHAAR